MSPRLQIALGLLRIATGISLLGPGLNKLGWFAHPALEPILANWAQHAPNGMVVRYLHLVAPYHAGLARIVAVGELGLGTLLVRGFNAFVVGGVAGCFKRRRPSAEEREGYFFPSKDMNNRLSVLRFVQDIPQSPADPAYELGLDGILGSSMRGAPRPL